MRDPVQSERPWNRFFVLFMMLVTIFSGCGKKEEAKKPKPPVPVLVAMTRQQDVPVVLSAIGKVEAYSTVTIKSLVAGEITGVNFREGQEVKKGDLLFTIDSRPLEADLRRAEGVLAKDRVEAANAHDNSERYAELYRKGIVAHQEYARVATIASSLKETIKADQAILDSLKVQLGYTKIYSPITGRTGILAVDKGNIIKANDIPLVVINTMQPLYVRFSMPEKFLPEVRRLMGRDRVKVSARSSGGEGQEAEGYLTFIDNEVDAAAGNIKLKATVDNADTKLWPGQFVDVVLTLGFRQGATVAPNQAVLAGQQGQYVFVVNPETKTVESRAVVMGPSQGNDVVVEQGLKPGEMIVTDGQMRLVPGLKVDIKSSL